ncbi:MAG: hypothetical protein FWG23_00845 [Eggerthellaceae bacterium]|jgi:hypothetical protein|nr:hypothetical protein [Eggerthellaceae bacterium]MDR2715631.1 hypothetical protein [Coriobacteriaceae bacterium]
MIKRIEDHMIEKGIWLPTGRKSLEKGDGKASNELVKLITQAIERKRLVALLGRRVRQLQGKERGRQREAS